MNKTRPSAAILLLALATLPWAGPAFSAGDGPIVHDYSGTGAADYKAPNDKSTDSSKAAGSASSAKSSGNSGNASKQASADSGGKPYQVDCSGSGPCKAGPQVMQGYQTFGGHCLRCHGQNAGGSTFAPSLVDAVNRENFGGQGQFTAAVAGGMTVKDTTTGGYRVMPSWANNADVMNNVGPLWAYIKALADGELKPGQPKPMGKGKG